MSTHEDDRWMRVLAGREQATSADERKISLLGSFLREEATEPESLSDAQVKRMMNGLEARGAFQPQATSAGQMAARPGFAKSLMTWLFPAQGGWVRVGSVAAAVLAVVVGVPLVREQMGGGSANDSLYEIKRGPKPGVNPDTTKSVGAVQQMRVASPEAASGELLLALGRHGISARVDADQVARTVTASIPEQRRAEVEPDLTKLGVQVPGDGHLVVRYEPQ